MEQVKIQRESYRQKRRERDNLPIGVYTRVQRGGKNGWGGKGCLNLVWFGGVV